jgi:hypothetical protein
MQVKIFISYSKKQPEPTRLLDKCLSALGYEVWWDTDLLAGQDFRAELDRKLDEADAVIVIWTPDSIHSAWVKAEADHGFRRTSTHHRFQSRLQHCKPIFWITDQVTLTRQARKGC